MRYTLKDYQQQVVSQVLRQLDMAHEIYHSRAATSQFSLSAATGSGKTVMAAAIIEALFFGNADMNFEPDKGAVVLWFSDDPSLNEQSRARITAASPELGSRMRVVEATFAEPELRPGYVYFLNAQKLSKNSRLVRGAKTDEEQEINMMFSRPDLQQATFYDVLNNTLTNPEVTLYMVLDEAHRGMGKPAKDRNTIVQRLINGQNASQPIPIVLGISATIERFTQAMQSVEANERIALPAVTVDPRDVQASGLLKDDVVLNIPSESGSFDTLLLRRGVEKLKASTAAWDAYIEAQGEATSVKPLMVVQVPDKSSKDLFTRIWDTVYETWPDLPRDAFANVFGEHSDIELGPWVIPYIEPHRVQDNTGVRVLLAKTAITNGWDCPRAEVMVSFRPAKDRTHITQLLGRMIRTPLARRIPGNELLNSVDCLLPFFDKHTASAVIKSLVEGGSGEDGIGVAGKRVLLDPVTLTRNPNLDSRVFSAFEELPGMTIPQFLSKPIPRCTAIAAALSKDGIIEDCIAKTNEKLCAALDGYALQFEEKVQEAREDVTTMSGEELRVKVDSSKIEYHKSFKLTADPRALEDSYRVATRSLSKQLCSAYVDHLVSIDEDDDKLLDAHIKVAALGIVPEIVERVETEATFIARELLESTRVERKNLSDADQSIYARFEAQAALPERTDIVLPDQAHTDARMVMDDGTEIELPTDNMHLLVDENGEYPYLLNDWETRVLKTEKQRRDFMGWYRNPERAGADSLAIAYEENKQWKALRPDFVFFADDGQGGIAVDIVDPHGYHLADALPKLRGLVSYAREYVGVYRRIEAVAKIKDDQLRVLDLTIPAVQEAIMNAEDAAMLYQSPYANDYQ